MKNSNGTIGNRTRDLPACNAVPQQLRHRVIHDLWASLQEMISSVSVFMT
jgi:hypothetical protein